MKPSSRLAARILLAIGGLAACGCDGTTTSTSTDGCHPTGTETCISREKAWSAVQGSNGSGGSSGSAGGSGSTPDSCPSLQEARSASSFVTLAGLPYGDLSAARIDGEQCCYTTTPLCEGRPFMVGGAQRWAPLGHEAGWG